MATMAGRSYFKITSAANLIGEFSNSGMSGMGSEYANILTNETGFKDTCRPAWSQR